MAGGSKKWLRAGAVAVGLGAAVAGGAGAAHADAVAAPNETTTKAPATAPAKQVKNHKAKPPAAPKRTPAAATAVPATTHKPTATTATAKQPTPVAATPTAALTSTAPVVTKSVPVPKNPALKFVAGVLSVFGLNSPVPGANRMSAMAWTAVRRIETFAGLVPNAGVATVTSSDPNTGAVTGALGFRVPAKLPMAYQLDGDPTRGTVTLGPSGTYTYTPTETARLDAGFGGPTTDTFTVLAGNGIATTRKTVTVQIAVLADKPTAPTSATQDKDFLTGLVTGTLTATDPAGKLLTYNLVSHATGTSVSVSSSGAYTYQPTLQSQYLVSVGGPTTDTFTVTATNGVYTSNIGTITVPIVGLADIPQAPTSASQLADTKTGVVTGTITAVDPGGHALSYQYETNPAHGTVQVLSDGSFTYTPTIEARQQAASGGPTTDTFKARASNGTYLGTIGTITVPIAPAAPAVVDTFAVNAYPLEAALNPSGTTLYVTNVLSSTVTVVNPASGTILGTIGVGTRPGGLVSSPDGTRLYVVNGNSNSVSVVDTTTTPPTTPTTIGVGVFPLRAAVSPDGKTVYVTNNQDGTVSVINTATSTVTTTIPVGANPTGVAFTPDGAHAYVANDYSNSVSVIDTATSTVTGTIAVGTRPASVAISPDGSLAYVTNYASDTVSVIDTATNTVTTTIPTGGTRANGAAFSPDGKTLYVTNYGGTVSVIDTATNKVFATVAVGPNAAFPAVDQTTGLVYVPNLGDGTISVISRTG